MVSTASSPEALAGATGLRDVDQLGGDRVLDAKTARNHQALTRAKLELSTDAIIEISGQAALQIELAATFASIGDWRGVNRQLRFLVSAVERLTQTAADADDLRKGGAA